MVARTAYVGTQSVGDVLTSANFSKLPGGWIGYVEVTADQTGITTEVDLTGLSVAVTVNSSRRIRIDWFATVDTDTPDQGLEIRLKESTTQLQRAQTNPSLVGPDTPNVGWWVGTPSAGSHTYKLTAVRTGGANTGNLRASSTSPAALLVTDIGPSS